MNIKKLGLASLLSTIGLLGAAGSAGAVGLILSPTGATVNSGGTLLGSSIANTYNQNGLTTGFASGVDDFDTAVAANQHTNVGGEWFKGINFNPSIITYDLGSIFSIDRLALWNENATGINSLNLAYSTDNITFSSLATGLNPTNNPIFPLSGTYGADVFSFASTDARYVRFESLNCPLGACSIGEVAFSANQKQVPEPSGIVGTSVLAIGFIGRKILKRRQQSIASKLVD